MARVGCPGASGKGRSTSIDYDGLVAMNPVGSSHSGEANRSSRPGSGRTGHRPSGIVSNDLAHRAEKPRVSGGIPPATAFAKGCPAYKNGPRAAVAVEFRYPQQVQLQQKKAKGNRQPQDLPIPCVGHDLHSSRFVSGIGSSFPSRIASAARRLASKFELSKITASRKSSVGKGRYSPVSVEVMLLEFDRTDPPQRRSRK
jgi:hypothetical protein